MRKFLIPIGILYILLVSIGCIVVLFLYFSKESVNFNNLLKDHLTDYVNSLTDIPEWETNYLFTLKNNGKFLLLNASRCENSEEFCNVDILYESDKNTEVYDDSNDFYEGSAYDLPFVAFWEYEKGENFSYYRGDFIFINKESKEIIKRIPFWDLCGDECSFGNLPNLSKVQKTEENYDVWFTVSDPENINTIYLTNTKTWEKTRYCIGKLPSTSIKKEEGKCDYNPNYLFEGFYIDYVNRDLYYTDNPMFMGPNYTEGLIPDGEEVNVYRYSIDEDKNSVILTNTVIEPEIQIYDQHQYRYATLDDTGKKVILNDL